MQALTSSCGAFQRKIVTHFLYMQTCRTHSLQKIGLWNTELFSLYSSVSFSLSCKTLESAGWKQQTCWMETHVHSSPQELYWKCSQPVCTRTESWKTSQVGWKEWLLPVVPFTFLIPHCCPHWVHEKVTKNLTWQGMLLVSQNNYGNFRSASK